MSKEITAPSVTERAVASTKNGSKKRAALFKRRRFYGVAAGGTAIVVVLVTKHYGNFMAFVYSAIRKLYISAVVSAFLNIRLQ